MTSRRSFAKFLPVGFENPKSTIGDYMRKLSSSILFLLIAASVPTAAYALTVNVYVTPPGGGGKTLAAYATISTPLVTDSLCTTAPCKKVVQIGIPDGTYSCLTISPGAYAELKVETNGTTIGTSTSITNSLNVSGTFKYTCANGGALEIENINEFNLRPAVAGSTTELGTWRTYGRGNFKCVKNTTTGKYGASSCTLNTTSLDSGTCTLCRAYGYTEEGYVLRPDPINTGQQLPASGVTVTMTSKVQYKDTAGNLSSEKSVIGAKPSLVFDILPLGGGQSLLIEDGHFYGGLSEQENIPCEPMVSGTCATTEIKKSTIIFSNMNSLDQVNLPPTGTDIGAPNQGVLNAILGSKINIDTQPIVVSPDPDNAGFFIATPNSSLTTNSEWNVGSNGTRDILALSTPPTKDGNDKVIAEGVNACLIEPFAVDNDGNLIHDESGNLIPNVFLSVAGSELVGPLPFDLLDPRKKNLQDFDGNGVCDGQVFKFSMPDINASIAGDTTAAKKETCFGNPNVTLIAGAKVVSLYEVTSTKGGKKQAYTASAECGAPDKFTGEIKCQVNAQVGGTQAILCSPKAGGN